TERELAGAERWRRIQRHGRVVLLRVLVVHDLQHAEPLLACTHIKQTGGQYEAQTERFTSPQFPRSASTGRKAMNLPAKVSSMSVIRHTNTWPTTTSLRSHGIQSKSRCAK